MSWPPDGNLLLTIFQSVLIEALPFVLIGILASALIEVFIDQDTIRRLLPRNRLVSIFTACFLGLLFPLCECGVVPVVRRLISKGVPVSTGITFMLAAPLINPVVITSTAMAFAHQPHMIAHRLIGGFLAAFAVGLVLELIYRRRDGAKALLLPEGGATHSHAHEHRDGVGCECGHTQSSEEASTHSRNRRPLSAGKLVAVLTHAGDEFFTTTRFLILGALLAALIQSVFSHQVLHTVGSSAIGSRLTMMGLAYGISLCSEADAFVASTFAHSFLPGAILSFLIFGPMIDVKNTLMLLGNFKARFVLLLITVIFAAVLTCTYLLGFLMPVPV